MSQYQSGSSTHWLGEALRYSDGRLEGRADTEGGAEYIDGSDEGAIGMCFPPPHTQHASNVLLPWYTYCFKKSQKASGDVSISLQVTPVQVPSILGSKVRQSISSLQSLGELLGILLGELVGTTDGKSEGFSLGI